MNDTEVIILAGGYGKRMESDLPKALVSLRGMPLIEHVLNSVKKSGVTDNPIVVVGQKREQVTAFLGDSVRYAVQEEQLGTGHAVICAINALREETKSVLVLYADHPYITAETVQRLVENRTQSNSTISLATVQLPNFEGFNEVFTSFGRIVRDTKGTIIKIVEARDATDEEKNITEVNPAYFCFDKKWLIETLPKLKNDNAQREYYLTDLIGIAMSESKKISSISIEAKEALGTNSKEDLTRAESL